MATDLFELLIFEPTGSLRHLFSRLSQLGSGDGDGDVDGSGDGDGGVEGDLFLLLSGASSA